MTLTARSSARGCLRLGTIHWEPSDLLLFSRQSLSHLPLFATSWAAGLQAPLSMGFPRQEYWSGLPFPSPEDLPYPGIEPVSPALAGGLFTTEPPEMSPNSFIQSLKVSTQTCCGGPGMSACQTRRRRREGEGNLIPRFGLALAAGLEAQEDHRSVEMPLANRQGHNPPSSRPDPGPEPAAPLPTWPLEVTSRAPAPGPRRAPSAPAAGRRRLGGRGARREKHRAPPTPHAFPRQQM